MCWATCHECRKVYADSLAKFENINYVPRCEKHRDFHHGGAAA